MGSVCKEVSREIVSVWQPGWAAIVLAWYVCPASFRPLPLPPMGCLALASLRHRYTVTACDAEGMGVPPRNSFLGPGKLDGFQVGEP